MNATFNPGLIDVTHLSDAQVRRLGHADEATPAYLQRQPLPAVHPMAAELRAASVRFDARRDDFARGKGPTCRDIADKLDRFGSFASEKQEQFAQKLVAWSLPRAQQGHQNAPGAPAAAPAVPTPAPAPVVRLEALHAVMQKHAKFYVGGLTLARKQGDQLVWLKHADAEKVVGKIDNGVLTLWSRQGVDMDDVRDLLQELNADPLAAARKYGKLSGRCCSCGADLVDPESIERGQGPVCAGKF